MAKKYIFYESQVPAHAEFSRVHALLVTKDGRVVLRYKNGEARITGGHIESSDSNVRAALEREILEECRVTIDRQDYVGYIKMEDEVTNEVEFWARMVARVERILAPKPDPDRDGNWVYGRALAPPEIAFAEMIGNFPTNKDFLPAALRIAREKKYFTKALNLEYEVLNKESHD